MKIKKLELHGFKSFKDRTVIHFDDGITGVVGPNGCGKSNIVDALQWVMGEQSAKHLRGSSMEDVIFAGSEGYAPMGMAEVSLILENDGGPFPAKYMKATEVMITRRLHRSGESEYLVNKEQARLKDIQEIFMDTGVGSKGFSIIEQGAIGKIITAKPEERRFLIEEAAGITKFKVRKRESERKLASTDQNLLRLNDIVGELKRQLESLQRQAKKAERYRELKNSVKDLELLVNTHRYIELQNDVETFKKNLDDLQMNETGGQAELQAWDAEIQGMKLRVAEIERKVNTTQEARFEAQTEVQRKESEIQRIQMEIDQAKRSEEVTGTRIQELEARHAALTQEIDQINSQLSGIETEAETLNTQFAAENETFQQERERVTELDNMLVLRRRESVAVQQAQSHLEAQTLVTETRVQEFTQREATAQTQAQELNTRREEYEKIKNKNFADLERERQMQLEIMNDVENFEANEKHLAQAVSTQSQKVGEIKDRMNKARGKLHGLQALDSSFEGFQEGVKNVMQWQEKRALEAAQNPQPVAQSLEGVTVAEDGTLIGPDGQPVPPQTEAQAVAKFSLVADAVSAPAEYEVALEALLGSKLQLVLTPNWEEPIKAIEFLKQNNLGRTSFFSSTDQYPVHSANTLPSSEVEAILLDVVQVREDYKVAIDYLLERVAVVESLERALSLRRRFPRWTFVTRAGDVVTSDGIVSGGTLESADTGVLRRRREIKELTQELEVLESQVAIQARELEMLEDRWETVQKDLGNARIQKSERDLYVAEKKRDLERSEAELNNLMQAITRQQKELNDIIEQKQIQENKLESFRDELEILREKSMVLAEEVESMTDELAQVRVQMETRSRVVTDLQVRAASKTQERDGLRRQLDMFTRQSREVEEQKLRMASESTRTSESLSQHQIQIEQEKIRLNHLIDRAETVKQELATLQNDYEVIGSETRAHEAKINERVKALHEAQSAINEYRLKLDQAAMKEQNITTQILEKYNVSISDVLEQFRHREVNLPEIESQLSDLKDKMAKMGEVSISAIDEYEELTQRYEFLTKQQSDLLEAQNQLRKVIDRIDKICSKQFKETFEQVNERFTKVFPILFGGGSAHLVLVEHEGDSEPGIDIVVRPPGKKSQNITLLSGGEKALTSVALIFAIFLVRPSPFCLLDEVDAPLDDANVFRFNELVREMAKRSQIIVVTHNKHTMEVNNKLYGVTMEERGVSKMVSVNLTDTQSRLAEATA